MLVDLNFHLSKKISPHFQNDSLLLIFWKTSMSHNDFMCGFLELPSHCVSGQIGCN